MNWDGTRAVYYGLEARVPRKIKTGLAHSAWGAPHCPDNIEAVMRGETLELCWDECGILSWISPQRRWSHAGLFAAFDRAIA